ncbi:MAG: sugar ABC transporter permease [Chloroflexota bacterium]|nr:sugar ABC transporter permease [Chloroflexota bacterium]PLS79138.1 MAG: sugar ABC transporter permease [Chloroflexota bacterium]
MATLAQHVRPKQKSTLQRRETIDAYLFLSPWLIGFVVLVAGPMLGSIALTMMRWDLIGDPAWVGMANFRRVMRDPLVRVSLMNTAFYTFLSVPLTLAVSLGTALLLNQRLRFQSVFRTFFYLPSVVPAVANALVWLWILNPDVGLANSILNFFGLPDLLWIYDRSLAKPTFIILTLWGVGNTMIVFLAGLQGIPQSLYEVADIDGANWWQRFRHVTLPMLSPVILFNLIIGIIGSFQVFTSAFILTNGGPQNATLFTVLYIYRLGFEQNNMGVASAVAWILFLIILIFSLIQLRLSRSWVYYEGE